MGCKYGFKVLYLINKLGRGELCQIGMRRLKGLYIPLSPRSPPRRVALLVSTAAAAIASGGTGGMTSAVVPALARRCRAVGRPGAANPAATAAAGWRRSGLGNTHVAFAIYAPVRASARVILLPPSCRVLSRFAPLSAAAATSSDAPPTQLSLNESESAAYRELWTLSARLRKLDEGYYGDGAQVTDDEYDALARREAEICVLHPRLMGLLEEDTGMGREATRFGGRVGRLYGTGEGGEIEGDAESAAAPKDPKSAAVKATRVKRHHLENAPMQSLDNTMDGAGVAAWLNRLRRLLLPSNKADKVGADNIDGVARDENNPPSKVPIRFTAEPKIDGLSLSLRYQLRNQTSPSSPSTDRVYDFLWAATRGDGRRGEDVSAAVRSAWMNSSMLVLKSKHGLSVPQSLALSNQGAPIGADPPVTLEIRGEVVLPEEEFDEFSKSNKSNDGTANITFSNARNAASGILLRSKEPTSQEELDQTRLLQSRLRFYAYDIADSLSTHADPSPWLMAAAGENGEEMRNWLMGVGFQVPTPVASETINMSVDKEVNETDIPNLLEYHRGLMSTRDDEGTEPQLSAPREQKAKTDVPYQIDGVVYKLSSFEDRRICGSSSRAPRWAIAHKFPPRCAVTRLIDVEVQVGRTGALTPVAILEPADLGGVTVSKASLHNFHYARKILLPNHVGGGSVASIRKGISVLVSRAGDVIPQVTKRIFDEEDESEISRLDHADATISLEDPPKCPACGSPTSFEFVASPENKRKLKKAKEFQTQSEETAASGPTAASSSTEEGLVGKESGQVLRCSGPQLLCPPRAVNALAYAYSRSGLDVKGLSKAKLSQLTDAGLIRFPCDLFVAFGSKSNTSRPKEEEFLGKIADLPGWGELSSQNLVKSVRSAASDGVSLSRYIYSLGIPLVGTHASQLVASAYVSVESFLAALDDASLDDHGDIAGNGAEEEESKPPFATLAGVKGIGPAAISSLVEFSKEEALREAARDLANALVVHDDGSRKLSGSVDKSDGKVSQFKGMTIVFTGTLDGMTRAAAEERVMALGARATPKTVSKSTNLLVEGEGGGKKARRAKELGVRVMDAAEFARIIAEG